jgi:hypothetical protein
MKKHGITNASRNDWKRIPMALSQAIATQFLFLHDITTLSLISSSFRQMIKDHLKSAKRLVFHFQVRC